MKVKVDTLIGPALDWAVVKCEEPAGGYISWMQSEVDRGGNPEYSRYSSSWKQSGPIIEREKIDVMWCGIEWCAYCMTPDGERQLETSGPTPLIAAMRAYVASKMGDEIEVPENAA
jgi:hypothetical protein